MKTFLQKIFASNDARAVSILIALTCLAHIPWLFTLGTFTSGDWAFIGNEKLLDFVNMSPLWVIDNLGDTSATPHFYFIRFLEGLIVAIGGSFALTEKIFYLIPMALGASIFSYVFLRQYFRPTLAVIGAIVYCFNTSYIFNHAGPLNIGTVYALAPLGLWLFMRIVTTTHKKRAAVIASIVFSIMIYYELRITLIVGLIAGLWLLYRFIIVDKKLNFLQQLIIPLLLFGALVALLNLFWLIPYVISSKEVTFSNLLERQLLVSFSDITNAMTLHHPFWTGQRPATFIEQPIPLYAWLIPAIAFFGLVLPNRRKLHIDVLFWTMVGLAGILLIKQVNEPFVNFYPWIFEKIPGFAAFRESSKFYLLVILAYSVLIPATLSQAREYLVKDKAKLSRLKPKTWKPIAYYALIGTATCVFLINIVPLVTGSFRTMYVERHMPADYAKFDAFLSNQQDYFRTLWFPTSSRWSTHTNKHPLVNTIGLDRDIWSRSLTTTSMSNATLRDKTTQLLSSESSNDLVDNMSVKYVVVPIRDTASEDDFIRSYGDDRQYYIRTLDELPYLKKIDIGLKDLAVYENSNYKPYVSTYTSIQQTSAVTKGKAFENLHHLSTTVLGQEFNYALRSDKTSTLPSTTIEPLLTQPSPNNTMTVKGFSSPELYKNESSSSVTYTINNGTITFNKKSDGQLLINGKPYATDSNDTNLQSFTLDDTKDYMLKFNDHAYDLVNREGTRTLGTIGPSGISFYEKSQKVPITNASFQNGPWQPAVEDCNNYDNNSDISMNIQRENRRSDNNILSLESTNHTACTTSSEITTPKKGDYLLTFDYRSEVANKVGYEIVFKDPNKKPIKKDIPVSSREWVEYNEIISIPSDNSVFSIRLFGYPEYRHQREATTQYDELSLLSLRKHGEVHAGQTDSFNKKPVEKSDTYDISYQRKNIDKNNSITNPSFENGLWQKEVFDCNNYDKFGDIDMNTSQSASDGKASLELSARTHVACTSKNNIPVNEGTSYSLSLDYQSPNAKTGGYTISFNDPLGSKVEKILPIKNGEWATQTDQIDVPYGATEATLTFYAYGSDLGRLKLVNRYDNVSLVPMVDLQNKYFLVDAAKPTTDTPPDVTVSSQNNTYKTISIKNAREGFYLQLNESYNPLWTLYPDKQASFFERLLPLANNPSVHTFTHMQLNGRQNAWYIDTKKLCTDTSRCHKNADGSYDIALVAEFSPQRFFYIGSIISIVTFLCIIIYLIIKRR